jgi:hypothetical protein
MKLATHTGGFFHVTDICRYLIAIPLDAVASGQYRIRRARRAYQDRCR